MAQVPSFFFSFFQFNSPSVQPPAFDKRTIKWSVFNIRGPKGKKKTYLHPPKGQVRINNEYMEPTNFYEIKTEQSMYDGKLRRGRVLQIETRKSWFFFQKVSLDKPMLCSFYVSKTPFICHQKINHHEILMPSGNQMEDDLLGSFHIDSIKLQNTRSTPINYKNTEDISQVLNRINPLLETLKAP